MVVPLYVLSLLSSLCSLSRWQSLCPHPYSCSLADTRPPGIPKLFASSRTLGTEVVKADSHEISFKLSQEWTPRVAHTSKVVNSLVTLTLDDEGKVRYHKDMWNEKDYSHEGLGMLFKQLNGDHLTGITRPEKTL